MKKQLLAIAFAAVAAAGIGAFGVIRLASHSTEPQESSVIEDVIDQKELETSKESKTSEEPEALEESDPIEEALEQYRIIVGQADSYDYGEYAKADSPWEEFIGYRYALVQMQPDDPAPTLLLEKEIMITDQSVSTYYARVFQYDLDTKTVYQPVEVIGDGGIRGGLSIAGDGYGIMSTEWSSGTGDASVTRFTLDGDSLNQNIYWTGQIFEKPDSLTFIEIEWHDMEDLSALDSWTAPDLGESEPSDSDTLPTDGNRIVLTGTVGTYDYDEIIVLQGQPDPNGFDEDSVKHARSITYRVIVLDTPQTLYIHSGGGDGYFSHEALMISIDNVDGMDQYEGQHITFSIDPDTAYWPSDTSLPLGQPIARDIHILD